DQITTLCCLLGRCEELNRFVMHDARAGKSMRFSGIALDGVTAAKTASAAAELANVFSEKPKERILLTGALGMIMRTRQLREHNRFPFRRPTCQQIPPIVPDRRAPR